MIHGCECDIHIWWTKVEMSHEVNVVLDLFFMFLPIQQTGPVHQRHYVFVLSEWNVKRAAGQKMTFMWCHQVKPVSCFVFQQLAATMQRLIELAGGPDKPHIICGDFNSKPTSAPYQLMSDGHLNDSSFTDLQAILTVDSGDTQVSDDSFLTFIPLPIP